MNFLILVPALFLCLTLGFAVTPLSHAQDGLCDKSKDISVSKSTVTKGRVMDILWVVDNSASMESYQNQVAKTVNVWIKEFARNDVDFNMAIIDSSGGTRHPGYTTSETSDRVLLNRETHRNQPETFFKEFRKTIRVGTKGKSEERLLNASVVFLQRHRKFLRTNAQLVIIFVSDVDEMERGFTPKAYVQALTHFKLMPDIYVTGLLDNNINKTLIYDPIVGGNDPKLSGKYGDIKDESNFGNILADIAQSAIENTAQNIEVPLPESPASEEFKVEMNGVLQSNLEQFKFDRSSNTVKFSAMIERDTAVRVTYKVPCPKAKPSQPAGNNPAPLKNEPRPGQTQIGDLTRKIKAILSEDIRLIETKDTITIDDFTKLKEKEKKVTRDLIQDEIKLIQTIHDLKKTEETLEIVTQFKNVSTPEQFKDWVQELKTKKKILVIFDSSGSMNGPGMSLVLDQALKLIATLPEDTTFNVATETYRGISRAFNEVSVPNSPEMIQKARHFIQTYPGSGGHSSVTSTLKTYAKDFDALLTISDSDLYDCPRLEQLGKTLKTPVYGVITDLSASLDVEKYQHLKHVSKRNSWEIDKLIYTLALEYKKYKDSDLNTVKTGRRAFLAQNGMSEDHDVHFTAMRLASSRSAGTIQDWLNTINAQIQNETAYLAGYKIHDYCLGDAAVSSGGRFVVVPYAKPLFFDYNDLVQSKPTLGSTDIQKLNQEREDKFKKLKELLK